MQYCNANSAVTPQINCNTRRMLILMLKTHPNHNFENFWPHFLSLSLCSPSALSPFTSKGLKPFVWNPIFLFRTRSVNKILCHLWPLWFYPAFFFPFFSLSSFPPWGMILSFAHFLCWDFFPLQGKMASIFSFTFMSLLLFLSFVGPFAQHVWPSLF